MSVRFRPCDAARGARKRLTAAHESRTPSFIEFVDTLRSLASTLRDDTSRRADRAFENRGGLATEEQSCATNRTSQIQIRKQSQCRKSSKQSCSEHCGHLRGR